MTFEGLDAVRAAMYRLGVQDIYCKALSENDNRKQQIYIGGDWLSLNVLPLGAVRSDTRGTRPNFKASLDFSWLSTDGSACPAPKAQLILYPDYPEIRLSGFLSRCRAAPAAHLQPVPKHDRKSRGQPDGRMLVLGTTGKGRIIAWLALPGSSVANAIRTEISTGQAVPLGLFYRLGTSSSSSAIREELLEKLRTIHSAGPISAIRIKGGRAIPTSAAYPHACGYTLEAELGLPPNGRPEPDYKGWELKSFGRNVVTIMEPEPDGGFYGSSGCRMFLDKYGKPSAKDGKIRFVGPHRLGRQHVRHKTTLVLRGFDASTKTIVDLDGGIFLHDDTGEVAASWSFSSLISHWGKKHHQAVYIPYVRLGDAFHYVGKKSRFKDATTGQIKSGYVVWMCEGTDFSLFLAALAHGAVYYDPGSSMNDPAVSAGLNVKGRNPFRVSKGKISQLYRSTLPEPVA